MTAMKQNVINETYSPLVRMMVTILVKTTGLMAFNKIWKCDINNKKNQMETNKSCLYHNHCHETPSHFIASPHCQEYAK